MANARGKAKSTATKIRSQSAILLPNPSQNGVGLRGVNPFRPSLAYTWATKGPNWPRVQEIDLEVVLPNTKSQIPRASLLNASFQRSLSTPLFALERIPHFTI